MTERDPIIRANQWKLAYDEEGGLKDMFEHIRREYFRRAGLVEPWEGEKLGKLALAGRIVDMVEDHVRHIIDTGKMAEADQIYAEKIADLPERKRFWATR